MRAHVDALGDARREAHRPDVIEEDEGPDHVPARVRQHAADFEAAEVAAPLVDDIHAGAFTRPATLLAREMGHPGQECPVSSRVSRPNTTCCGLPFTSLENTAI